MSTTFELLEWLKKRDWPSVLDAMIDPERNFVAFGRSYQKVDEHGRLPLHWLAAKAQTHTHTLAMVGVQPIGWNPEALITQKFDGETPIDIARRSGAC